MMAILSAKDNEELFALAERFVLPYEKYCCALMQRIISHDSSVYLLCEDTTDKKVQGVFSYNKGRSVFHCLPRCDDAISGALNSFFAEHHVFCITGERSGTEFLQKILKSIGKDDEAEVRDYFFMEYRKVNSSDSMSEEINVKPWQILQCSENDADKLMPLQLSYVKEEVLPVSREVNPPAERIALEQLLRAKKVFVLVQEGQFVSKVHINAQSDNVAQLGGTYTVEAKRRNGFASALVRYVSEKMVAEKKQPVLFVKEKNRSAFHAYERVGFVQVAKYRIVYYED